MLAYVFAHRATAGVDPEEYASRLIEFHRTLATTPPAGFIESWVWQRDAGPPGDAFEDWYLVDDWAALGVLNQAAVTGERRAPHDAVAALSGDGAGGIYRLGHGEPTAAAHYRTRVSKPAGVSYDALRPRLERAVGSGGALWQRQMVLGPDAEFLIDSPAAPDPAAFDHPVEVTPMRSVYTGAPQGDSPRVG